MSLTDFLNYLCGAGEPARVRGADESDERANGGVCQALVPGDGVGGEKAHAD